MSTEENKAIILRAGEAEAKGGPEAGLAFFETICDPACTIPDLAFYGLPPTLEGYKQLMAGTGSAFSDFSQTLEAIVAEGDTVMVWGTLGATHSGPWRNIAATNKRISWRAVEYYRFARGKVIEFRFLFDTFALLQQIGAIPKPG
jgi:predicted ester cyclase